MKQKYRIHLLGLAHLPTTKEYMSCAFTQKNRKLAKMLTDAGHDVIFYGAEGSLKDLHEYAGHGKGAITVVETHTLADIAQDYGDGDNRFEIGYNWKNTDFRHDFNTDRKPSTLKYYANTINYILENKQDDDILFLTQGYYQKPIADAVNLFLTVEGGIGYRGSFARFRAFESAYIQNFTYGSEHPYECINGSYYDRVIPNYFDPADVEFSDQKEDYYLFIGRMIKRKGIITAYKTAEALGKKLIIVGQGGVVTADGSLTATTDPDFIFPKGHWEYRGYADVETRKKLMAHAKVTFTPTEYLECFAGTHIESMLAGTPVLTTDFGVFTGTVFDGVNGYKCHTLQDFVDNAILAEKLNPHTVRASADKYLMDNVAKLYLKWFDDLHNVYESAVNPELKGWNRLDPKYNSV